MKEYLKWLFTRGYLYVMTLVIFSYYYEEIEGPFFWEIFLGQLLGNLIGFAIMISIIVGIKRLFKKMISS